MHVDILISIILIVWIGTKCLHVAKAVNLNKVKKNIKKTGIMSECAICKKIEVDFKKTEEIVNDILFAIETCKKY